MNSVDELNRRVTDAIFRAERAERLGDARDVWLAYMEVSALEEAIAAELPASETQGAIARRGAVTAALSAQEFVRARELASGFLSDPLLPGDLRSQLRALLDEANAAMNELLAGAAPEVIPAPFRFKPAA